MNTAPISGCMETIFFRNASNTCKTTTDVSSFLSWYSWHINWSSAVIYARNVWGDTGELACGFERYNLSMVLKEREM